MKTAKRGRYENIPIRVMISGLERESVLENRYSVVWIATAVLLWVALCMALANMG